MKKRLKTIALCLVVAFSMTNTAAFAVQGGSVGQGNFSVMQGGKLVDKLSGQNPIQDESLMVCDGKCMVKSEGISLTAADKAKFAIKNEADTFRLFLSAGSVDYVITDKARKIAFHTPEGVYSVAYIIFNAASKPVVRGTVTVNADGKTEISVKEGRMSFATADGMKTVGANEKIVLAMAQVQGEKKEEKCNDNDDRDDNDCDKLGAWWLTGGAGAWLLTGGGAVAAAAAAAVAVTAVVVNNNNNNNEPPVPPNPSPNS